jgi:hypothetical protein
MSESDSHSEPNTVDLYSEAEATYLRLIEWREKTLTGFFGILIVLSAGFGWSVTNAPNLQWLAPAPVAR